MGVSPGETPETAIPINAENSLQGIPAEFAVLEAMFGKRSHDWKLIDRMQIETADSRKLERFIISAANQRKDVYFDITKMLAGNTETTSDAMRAVAASHDRPVSVLLPREEFFTLHVGLIHLTESQLKTIGLTAEDQSEMAAPLSNALKPWFGKEIEQIPTHLPVTASLSVWIKIKALLASWEPRDLLQEEELENLKAIIGGGLRERY